MRAYSGYAYVESALMLRVTAIVRRVGADVTRALLPIPLMKINAASGPGCRFN
jgi:hypothetical protein